MLPSSAHFFLFHRAILAIDCNVSRGYSSEKAIRDSTFLLFFVTPTMSSVRSVAMFNEPEIVLTTLSSFLSCVSIYYSRCSECYDNKRTHVGEPSSCARLLHALSPHRMNVRAKRCNRCRTERELVRIDGGQAPYVYNASVFPALSPSVSLDCCYRYLHCYDCC